jgi:hypothetical protein
LPSPDARREIPARMLAIYRQAGVHDRIPWQILAGIGREECDHGLDHDPSCTPKPGARGPGAANPYGASGPMQIGVTSACPRAPDCAGDQYDALRRYLPAGRRGLGPHDPMTAVSLAALALIHLAGGMARRRGIDAYWGAARAYNGSGPAAAAYADRVVGDAHRYASGVIATANAGGCADAAALVGAGGRVMVLPGANRAGVGLKPVLLRYLAGMAALAGRTLYVSTGTNHGKYTVDGNISDHWDGHAADLGMAANGGTDGGHVGDQIMTACLELAGDPPRQAAAEAIRGGLYTRVHGALRVQCIWKTYEGGDHYNHVHVGVRPSLE